MNCSQCGYQLNGEKYCPQCGTQAVTQETIKTEINNARKKVFMNGRKTILIILGILSFIATIIAVKKGIDIFYMEDDSDGNMRSLALLILLVFRFPIMDAFLAGFITLLKSTRKNYKDAMNKIKTYEPQYRNYPEIKEMVEQEELKEEKFSSMSSTLITISYVIIGITALPLALIILINVFSPLFSLFY